MQNGQPQVKAQNQRLKLRRKNRYAGQVEKYGPLLEQIIRSYKTKWVVFIMLIRKTCDFVAGY